MPDFLSKEKPYQVFLRIQPPLMSVRMSVRYKTKNP